MGYGVRHERVDKNDHPVGPTALQAEAVAASELFGHDAVVRDPEEVAACGIDHVVAVHRGVTRALFRIVPDSWEFDTSYRNKNGDPIRYIAFQVDVVESGSLFDEIVGPYGHRAPA